MFEKELLKIEVLNCTFEQQRVFIKEFGNKSKIYHNINEVIEDISEEKISIAYNLVLSFIEKNNS